MTLAHAAVAPSAAWTSWTLDPALVVALAAAAWVYARRARSSAPERRQVVAFYSGLLLIALALMSPVEAVASSLVSGHMVQHLILLVAAPVLLVYGARGALRAARVAVITIVVAHATTMWIWHLPGPYGAAVENEMLHAFEHATFLVTALLFWALVVQPSGRRVAYPAALLSALALWVLSGGLGALLTFSSSPLYPALGHHASEWGLSAIGDQQLAGVVMWVPAGFAYLIAMAVLFVRWMDSLERPSPQPAQVTR